MAIFIAAIFEDILSYISYISILGGFFAPEKNKNNHFKIVIVLYGSRYEKEGGELLDLLKKYDSFRHDCKKYRKNKYILNCPLIQREYTKIKSSIFSLGHKIHIITTNISISFD